MLLARASTSFAQSETFAGNAQHTAQYEPAAQRLNQVLWSTAIDLRTSGAMAHYGAPLVTPSNTVIVSVRTTNAFQVRAFEGATGRLKYTLTNNGYQLPSYGWMPTYQPVLANPPSGTRLYYAGPGGTVYFISNPDAESNGAPTQVCFYTNLTAYSNNAAAFNSNVFINTPITADTNGVIFFGFRVEGGIVPPPLSTTNSGFARIDPDGNGRYVLARQAAGNDSLIYRDSHNCAPALSRDGTTVYVTVKGSTANYAYLLGLDSTNLTTKYSVLLKDPRNGAYAGVLDDATASPLVAPDGDVYLGVGANPNNASRGFLLHFSADLQTQKPPGAFGWDYTPAIVPTNVVPSYKGTSPYLLFSKYNNYAGSGDGNGINRIALLDPNSTQIDPHPTAPGLVEMRELYTVIGFRPDNSYQGVAYPYAVREWCINTAAVNPATSSVLAPCEDGRIYRWNFALNSITEVLTLGPGVGEPYVPTVVAPDGIIFTLNGGKLFALGSLTNISVAIYSSAPDLSSGVLGQPVTFTAVVTNLGELGSVPTGTVTFQDLTYQGTSAVTNILAANIPLTNGLATFMTSDLFAGSNNLGNHFITATYSGDTNFPTGSATLVQKVHANATHTDLTFSTETNQTITLTATVSSIPPGGKPTGMVTFWDGTTLLGQIPLNTNSQAILPTGVTNATASITATYSSDTVFASSSGHLLIPTIPLIAGWSILSNGAFQLSFSNVSGVPFTVLGSTDLFLPLSNWPVLGAATEIFPGQFEFSDPDATNYWERFYRVRSP